MAGKYTPLEHSLRNLPVTQKEVTMSFERIEQVLNDKLPTSAKKYSAWWNNEIEGSHVQARGWIDAGWRVDTVNLKEKWVRFIRA